MPLLPPGREHRDAERALFRVSVARVTWVILDACRPPLSHPAAKWSQNIIDYTFEKSAEPPLPAATATASPPQNASRPSWATYHRYEIQTSAARIPPQSRAASALVEHARTIGTALGGTRSLATSCRISKTTWPPRIAASRIFDPGHPPGIRVNLRWK